MHSPTPDETRNGDNVQQTESQSHVANDGEDIAVTTAVFALCDVDLPCFVLDGTLYVQAPLQDVFDAFAAYFSDGLRNLETRISEARSTSLAFDGFQRAFYGETVVVPRVGDSGQQR